ncbi:MAG TPA: hypothetical protein VF988_02735, partial [Verrucomicrobiae bacterium]
EAVYRYVNFLLGMAQTEEMSGQPEKAAAHFDDAIMVAETCQKLDPYNESIKGLINTVKSYKEQVSQRMQAYNQVETMETVARTNPANVQNLVALGGVYMQMQQTNRAVELFNTALSRPEVRFNDAAALAQYFAQLGNYGKLETAIRKMVSLAPDQPEPRCDLAALEAMTGRSTEALSDLKAALELNTKRRAQDPKAADLVTVIRTDPRFGPLRSLPEFQKILSAQ